MSIQDRLERYLRTVPQWRSSRVEALSEIGHGWESVIHGFGIDHEKLVLRRYAGRDASEKAAREFGGMRLLGTAGYPVPEVLVLETDPQPLGSAFILMRYVEGEALWTQVFGEQVREDLLQVFVQLFVRLHRLEWQPFENRTGSDLLERELSLWGRISAEYPISGFEVALGWLADRARAVPIRDPAVVHWDFHPDNVLYSEEGGPWVLDWTQIGVSDPRFDVAWTLLLVSAVEGEQWRSRLLALYEHTARTELPAMEFFITAAIVKRLYSVAVSLVAGPEALGMRAEAAGAIEAQRVVMSGLYNEFHHTTRLRIPGIEEVLS